RAALPISADVERARAAAIANLAEQMVGQSQQNALQAAALAQQGVLQQNQLAQQQWQNLSNNIMRGIQTGLLGAQMWSDWTGLVPFGGGQFTLGSRQALSNIGEIGRASCREMVRERGYWVFT